jgi:hypothetical protein
LLTQSVTCAFTDAAVPGAGSLVDLLPHLDDLLVDRVVSSAGAGGVVIEARCGSAGAACPAGLITATNSSAVMVTGCPRGGLPSAGNAQTGLVGTIST